MATYYVRKDGSDSNTGLVDNAGGAWLTLSKATTSVSAGDTVLVHVGSYAEHLHISVTGTVSGLITFKAFPGDDVDIDGTTLGASTALILFNNNMSYVTVDGFTLHNATDSTGGVSGGWATTTDHLTVKNLNIHDCNGVGIWFGNGTGSVVTNLIIDNCICNNTNINGDSEVISLSRTDGFEIKNCIVSNPGETGRVGIDMKVGTKNGSVHNCEVFGVHYTGIYVDARGTASNIAINNNYIHDCLTDVTADGISIDSETDGTDAISDIRIFNNIIDTCERAININITGHTGTTYDGIVIENNTFYNNRSVAGIWLNVDHAKFTNGIIRNNIIYGITNGMYAIQYPTYGDSETVIDYNLFYNSGGNWDASNVLGTDYIADNPDFVTVGSNFYIQAGSPAIDAGSDTLASATDYIGITRVNPDIGAYAYFEPETDTYYVDNGVGHFGSDSNDGSWGNPWLTITKAESTISAGDTAYVHAGTYNELIVLGNSGSAGSYKSLKGYPGDTVIIDGTGLTITENALFYAYGCSYWDIENLTIANANTSGKCGIYFYGNNWHHVILKDLIIHDTDLSGIAMAWSRASQDVGELNLLIDGCETYNTNASGGDEGVSLFGVSYYEIKNCTIHDTLGDDHIKEGIDCKNGCNHGSVHDNYVYNTYCGIKIDTYQAGTTDIDFYNNLIVNCDCGIAVISEDGWNVDNVNVYNNIVNGWAAGNAPYLVGYNGNNHSHDYVATFTNIKCYNNTFYSTTGNQGVWICGSEVLYDVASASKPGGQRYINCLFVNNIIDTHNNSGSHTTFFYDPWMETNVPTSDMLIDNNLYYTSSGEDNDYFGTNAINDNPEFVAAGSNFYLLVTSPALNAGSSVVTLADDYVGTPRPQGTYYDLGALEYIHSNPLTHRSVGSSLSEAEYLSETAHTLLNGVADSVLIFDGSVIGGSPAFLINFSNLPIYANNAAALVGGLTVGRLYRTGYNPDVVCVVH